MDGKRTCGDAARQLQQAGKADDQAHRVGNSLDQLEDLVKTDRRDASLRRKLHRTEELTAV